MVSLTHSLIHKLTRLRECPCRKASSMAAGEAFTAPRSLKICPTIGTRNITDATTGLRPLNAVSFSLSDSRAINKKQKGKANA